MWAFDPEPTRILGDKIPRSHLDRMYELKLGSNIGKTSEVEEYPQKHLWQRIQDRRTL
jgi:hypothetical protein